MKKSEIAAHVFEKLETKPLAPLGGGGLAVPVSDLAGLSLVPWFCDESVQWGFRISQPGKPLKKSILKKVSDSYIVEKDGAVLAGVPGDGISPSTFTLFPLAEAIAKVVQPGMTLELATANLGIVKRDWETKAETASDFGDQRYLGSVGEDGAWTIAQSASAMKRADLEGALACGRMAVKNGPWIPKDRNEAAAVLMRWMQSPAANINFAAVKRFVSWKDGALSMTDQGMVERAHGLALGFFQERLAGGPFQWAGPGPAGYPDETYQDVVKAILG